MTSSTRSRAHFSRRSLAKASALFGAAGASPAFLRLTSAQTPAVVNTEVTGKLVEWGFGIAETNPMARARVMAFQEAFPNVELEIVESFDEQKLLTAVASETVPDVLWLSRFETATWAARDVLMPLTDYIERDGYDTSVFYESALDESTYEDQIYGIPGGMDVRALFFNLDHLKEAGIDPATIDTSNWDQLNEFGAKLVKKEGDSFTRWGFDNKLPGRNFWLWGKANGGNFMNEDATEATFNDEKVVEALEWGVKTYDDQGGFQGYESFATTWQGDEQFARGQVAITLYEQWMMSGPIASVAPDLNFAVMPVRERGSGADGPTASFVGGNSWYIPAAAKNPDAAWEYIKFLHSVDTWRIGAEATKALRKEQGDRPYIPSLTGNKAADQMQIDEIYEPVGQAYDDAVKLFPQIMEESQNREIGKSPVAGQLEDIMADEGVEPALRGEMSAADALDQANQSAQDAIDSM
jgi:multiple sugar transport system substrate-binding protein